MSWDLDEDEARVIVSEKLALMTPPQDDEWIITAVRECDWGWVISWNNRRRAEGSTATRDLYAGGGPFMVDRSTARVAMAGSAHPVDHYIDMWRSGQWPDVE